MFYTFCIWKAPYTYMDYPFSQGPKFKCYYIWHVINGHMLGVLLYVISIPIYRCGRAVSVI